MSPISQPTPLHALASVGGAVAVGLLLALVAPSTRRGLVGAVVPWAIVGALLHRLAAAGSYPPELAPLFGPTLVYTTTFAIAGTVWLPFLQAAHVRDVAVDTRYLTAAGSGVCAVLAVGLAVSVLSVARQALVPMVGVPLLAAVLAGGGYLTLGFVDASAFARARGAGYLLVFAHTFDAVTVAYLSDVQGLSLPRPVMNALLSVGATLPAATTLGTGWTVVLLNLLGSVVLVALLTRGDGRTEGPRFVAFGIATAVGLGPAVGTLLLPVTT